MAGAADYYSAYGSLASYFGQSGGSPGHSPGRAGGAGYSNDISTGAGASGDVQSPSASSGSGWISAAASTSTTDKSFFSTPFSQQFGGIVNNQIIQSPGATNAASPVFGAPVPGNSVPGAGGFFGAGPAGVGGGLNLTLILLAAVALLAFKVLK